MFALARRILPVLGLVLAVGAGGAEPPATSPAAHTLTGYTTEQEATIDWALGLFDDAGLPLPGIDFLLRTTVEPCNGRRGWYQRDHPRAVVHVCTFQGGPVPEPLILHELAHAWDGHRLTDQRRADFLDWRGLRQWWGDERDHWGEYGAEQAAEVIVWGVIDRPIRATQLPPPYNGCNHLRTAYLMLTGHAPLHGYTDRCRRAESDDLGPAPPDRVEAQPLHDTGRARVAHLDGGAGQTHAPTNPHARTLS